MDQISMKAYAKINLTLDVVGKRADGYHTVQMIMQQIDLYDHITLTPRDEGIALTSDNSFIPANSQNLAWRAVLLLQEALGLKQGVEIAIRKQIPVAAGLAGGSTDAAAVIHGYAALCGIELSLEDKMALGLRLGADIPFCLMGGAALAEGIGELLTPIRGLRDGWLVVCKPNFGVSTREVYQALQWDAIGQHPDTAGMLRALEVGTAAAVCPYLGNVLEEVTCRKHPEVRKLKERMLQYGADGALMSGSGPTVFGVFRSADKARRACENLKRFYRQTYAVKTITNQGDQR